MNKKIEEYIEEKWEKFEAFKLMALEQEAACLLCEKAMDYWGKEGRRARFEISDNFEGTNLKLFMAKDDTIEKDVQLFLEYFDVLVKYNEGFLPVGFDEYVSGRWIQYHYSNGKANIWLFFHYDKAESCKVVGTGKFKEEMKRICV
ncbi:MAG: hypothetical protein HN597_16570 [Desulfobacula sp.]|jgi:hypothetical protein|uniref:hypothetical protein n=1 Tax=Desulfobacula sp. TaxID=2593537 RepID=UPI0039B847FC|nr:hypothetical protein [Desulfobacula sp.]